MVLLDLSHPEGTTRIGTEETLEMRGAMQQLLMEHRDVFTWSYKDMPRIDSEVMQHHLSVDPKVEGVR